MALLLAGMLLLNTAAATEEEMQAFAEQAGVDATELAGAVNTTGMDPYNYLIHTGHLKRPAPAGPAFGGVWDLLATCESGGNWASASNPRYKGGVQMDSTFWRNYGGLAFAPAPHLASKAQQITVAERGQRVQGWQAWPTCSRRLGLR